IVDEGPGATGETFACVAAWVESLGVDPKRIVLFSHHASGLALAPNGRRRWFARQRRFIPQAADDGLAATSSAPGLPPVEDLSAGRWRAVVPDSSTLPACSHHERRKHLARGEDGRSYVLRYVGRGRWGRAAIDRALQLAELGIGPDLLGWSNGFVATRW